jgi:hypothetical protein
MTRDQLRRALALNALTKPLNVVVPAGMVVAGVLVGAVWLLVVAAAVWLALVGATFFDEREAQRVGERERAGRQVAAPEARSDPAAFTPAIGRRLEAALAARASIHAAVDETDSPHADVVAEVDALVTAMEADSARAQRIHEFLAQESPDAIRRRIAEEPSDEVRAALAAKLDALTRLQQRLDRLLSELDHVVITLQTTQAEILAADGMAHDVLAGQVSELRTNVKLISDGLAEAFADTRAHGV